MRCKEPISSLHAEGGCAFTLHQYVAIVSRLVYCSMEALVSEVDSLWRSGKTVNVDPRETTCRDLSEYILQNANSYPERKISGQAWSSSHASLHA